MIRNRAEVQQRKVAKLKTIERSRVKFNVAPNMEQPRPDRQTHKIQMTNETARIEVREIAMTNIERQTPNRQTYTFFPQQSRRLPANQRLARSAKPPTAGKGVEIVVPTLNGRCRIARHTKFPTDCAVQATRSPTCLGSSRWLPLRPVSEDPPA